MLATCLSSIKDALAQADLPAGTVIAISGPSSYTYLMLLLAIWQSKLIALPLNPKLPIAERERVLQQASAALLIADEPSNIVPTMSWLSLPNIDQQGFQTVNFEWNFKADQRMNLILTSGSSSQPKLALHSAGNHFYSALGSSQNIPMSSDSRALVSLPLYHVGGLASVVRALLAKSKIFIPDIKQSLKDAIQEYRPTHLSLVATQLSTLLKDPDIIPSLKAIKHILLGGSAIPNGLIDQACDLGLHIHTSYGSTEMSSQISCTPSLSNPETLKSAGYLLPERELRITANNEIQVRGKTLFQGYFEQGKIHLPLNDEGWFSTHDSGFFDAQNRLHISGRLDNQFISGGENIQPEEIEKALLNLQGIQEALVLAIADPHYGQRPVAFVRAEAWEPVHWKQELRACLPKFKCPDAFYIWPENRIGLKPSRREFAEILQQELMGFGRT